MPKIDRVRIEDLTLNEGGSRIAVPDYEKIVEVFNLLIDANNEQEDEIERSDETLRRVADAARV